MIGQTISHYRILEKLGEGGMGVVYKAQDIALDRPVALKFLPPDLTVSEQDKARFIQEAKAAGILSHPNICPIHAIEEHQGQLFIVMDFVDGQTLRARKREFTIKEAVDIGIQIADGLGAAHEKGVVHRDIKPENIMTRKGGIVQIMDFGLAKVRGASKLTKAGTMLGTLGYMSPEQVQGQDLDHRSDIFSLGVLMYELFTGQLPFKGVHEAAILYEIVNVEAAPMSSIKPDIDPELDRIVFECMQKEPDERYQAAKDISRDLKRFKRESSRSVAARVTSPLPHGIEPPSSSDVRHHQLAWSLAALLSIVGIIVLGFYLLRSPERKHPIRSYLLPPDSVNLAYGRGAEAVIISPNGREVAFVGLTPQRQRMLYVQPLDESTAHQLSGTEGAFLPFWSPNNEFIGFFAGAKLKKVTAKGGSPVTICSIGDAPRGASWGKDGRILFVPSTLTPLYVVSEGGTPVVLTRLDSSRGENSHRWPCFLPDGKHFFYYARTANVGGEAEGDAIYIASPDMKLNKRLLNASGNAAYAGGYLLFMSKATLMAQRFDEDAMELKGEAVAIADQVLHDSNYGCFAVSNTGILVYQTGEETGNARLLIVDRSGKEVSLLGEVTQYATPRFSPDDKYVAVSIYDSKSHNQNLWMYDLSRGSKTRLTSGMSHEVYPIWSSDGSRIIYTRIHGNYGFYQRLTSGIGNEVLLYEMGVSGNASDLSRDGKYVLFDKLAGAPAKWGIWVLQLDSEHKTSPFLQTEFNQQGGRFSADGKCVAYMSDETGGNEVFVRPFPGPGKALRISLGGGRMPRWNRNRNELCYVGNDYRIMAVDIKVKGSTVEAGQPRPLFTAPMSLIYYDCSSDGNRFVICRSSESQAPARIRIVQNWDADLNK